MSSDADSVTVRRRSTPNPTTTMLPSLGGLVSAGKTPAEIAHALDVSLDEAWDRIVKAGMGNLIPVEKRLGPIGGDDGGDAPGDVIPVASFSRVVVTPASTVEASPEPPTTTATSPSTPPPPPPAAERQPALPHVSTTPKAPTMTQDASATTPTPTADAPAPKRRGGRPKGSKNASATTTATPPALSAADRKVLAVGKVYLIAEQAKMSIKELVALITEAFGTSGSEG